MRTVFVFKLKGESYVTFFLKTQGTKTKTLLSLATVGIISAFLVGSPQHASADQTYVSDPNQALTFSELGNRYNYKYHQLKQVFLLKHLLL